MQKKAEKLHSLVCGLTAAQINSAFRTEDLKKLWASMESNDLDIADLAQLSVTAISEKTTTL